MQNHSDVSFLYPFQLYKSNTKIVIRGMVATATPSAGDGNADDATKTTATSTTNTDGGDETKSPKDEEDAPDVAVNSPGTGTSTLNMSVEARSELKQNLKPSAIVESLNRHIVGQHDAKRAVAIAMRNRWRRRQLSDDLRKEVTPRNVLLVGPTG
jgi:hypothetical protein